MTTENAALEAENRHLRQALRHVFDVGINDPSLLRHVKAALDLAEKPEGDRLEPGTEPGPAGRRDVPMPPEPWRDRCCRRLTEALADYPGILDDSALFAWERRVAAILGTMPVLEESQSNRG